MIKGVLLDLSGVVYVGSSVLPGALEAIDALHRAKLPVRFVTNTTRTPKCGILERLKGMGLGLSTDELFTPAQAALDWLRAHDQSAHLLIHPNLAEDFEDVRSGTSAAVVIGDAGDGFSYAALNSAFRQLSAGADFLALAANRTFKDADNELSLDAGAFVAALEFACQRKAMVLGKPSKAFYAAALASMDCGLEEGVMVGDDAEADVSGALAAGLGAALLVRTGKYQPGIEGRFDPPPTAVIDDLPAAVKWILENRAVT